MDKLSVLLNKLPTSLTAETEPSWELDEVFVDYDLKLTIFDSDGILVEYTYLANGETHQLFSVIQVIVGMSVSRAMELAIERTLKIIEEGNY